MQEALFLPIRPYYSYHIMIGDKLWEVRTRKLPTDIDIYGYVTKGKPRFSVVHDYENGKTYYYINSTWGRSLNGDVPFKFRVGEIIEVPFIYDRFQLKNGLGFYDIQPHDLPLKSCLSIDDINAYGKGKTLYFHEITNLQIFDKPMVLGEFYKEEYAVMPNGVFPAYQPLTKAPQKYQFVWVNT